MSTSTPLGTARSAQVRLDRHTLAEDLLDGIRQRTRGTGLVPRRREEPAAAAERRGAAQWTPDLVTATVLRRRAVHVFDDLVGDLERIRLALGEARAADAELWPGEVAADRPVELVLLAWRVPGLDPGAYRVGTDLHLAPVPAVAGAGAPTARQFVIQDEFAAAPFMLLAGGDLAAGLAAHGLHGHRLLALRAATALHTAWLTTVALGGHGCLFGGVVDHAMRTWAGAGGHHRSLVLGAALGHAPQSWS